MIHVLHENILNGKITFCDGNILKCFVFALVINIKKIHDLGYGHFDIKIVYY